MSADCSDLQFHCSDVLWTTVESYEDFVEPHLLSGGAQSTPLLEHPVYQRSSSKPKQAGAEQQPLATAQISILAAG